MGGEFDDGMDSTVDIGDAEFNDSSAEFNTDSAADIGDMMDSVSEEIETADDFPQTDIPEPDNMESLMDNAEVSEIEPTEVEPELSDVAAEMPETEPEAWDAEAETVEAETEIPEAAEMPETEPEAWDAAAETVEAETEIPEAAEMPESEPEAWDAAAETVGAETEIPEAAEMPESEPEAWDAEAEMVEAEPEIPEAAEIPETEPEAWDTEAETAEAELSENDNGTFDAEFDSLNPELESLQADSEMPENSDFDMEEYPEDKPKIRSLENDRILRTPKEISEDGGFRENFLNTTDLDNFKKFETENKYRERLNLVREGFRQELGDEVSSMSDEQIEQMSRERVAAVREGRYEKKNEIPKIEPERAEGSFEIQENAPEIASASALDEGENAAEISEQRPEFFDKSVDFVFSDGSAAEVSLDPANLAKQYDSAKKAGDEDAMERIRALHELSTLYDSLDLTDGNPDIPQLGGIHKNVRGAISGFESHHMPANSSTDVPRNLGATIAIDKTTHSLTDSYRGRNNAGERQSFLPDVLRDKTPLKNRVAERLDHGEYVETVRNEVYRIRDVAGNDYDGALKQFFEQIAQDIAQRGIPRGIKKDKKRK